MSSHFLLQGFFPTHGWNTCLLLGRKILYCLSHQGSLKVKVKSLSHVKLFATPWTVARPGSSVHGIFQARLLEWLAISSSRGIFPTQGSNLGFPCCRQTLYHLSHQGSHGDINCTFRIIFNSRRQIMSPFHHISMSRCYKII